VSQAANIGPYRGIVRHGRIKGADFRREPPFVLVLECGHQVRRYLVRIQARGMARCCKCHDLKAERAVLKQKKSVAS
jgi:hypothetical protein